MGRRVTTRGLAAATNDFVQRALTDAVSTRADAAASTPCVAVLGGSTLRGADPALARELGSALAKAGLPVRAFDRPGTAPLVQAMHQSTADARVEAIDINGRLETGALRIVRVRTEELARPFIAHNASAYVALPGGSDAHYDVHTIWTLMRTKMIPERPIILAGAREHWTPLLQPLIAGATAAGTMSPNAISGLTFADSVAAAMEPLAKAHAEFKPTPAADWSAFADRVIDDLGKLPEFTKRFEHASVILGGAVLPVESPEYAMCVEFCERLAFRTRSGGGQIKDKDVGAMHAAAMGTTKHRDGEHEAVGITGLPNEQLMSAYVTPHLAINARTLEIRERLLLEKASSYVFFAGSSGSFSELNQVFTLIKNGELPLRPILLSPFYRQHWEAALARGGLELPKHILAAVHVCSDVDEMTARATAAHTAISKR